MSGTGNSQRNSQEFSTNNNRALNTYSNPRWSSNIKHNSIIADNVNTTQRNTLPVNAPLKNTPQGNVFPRNVPVNTTPRNTQPVYALPKNAPSFNVPVNTITNNTTQNTQSINTTPRNTLSRNAQANNSTPRNTTMRNVQQTTALQQMINILKADGRSYHINKVIKNIGILHNRELNQLWKETSAEIKQTDYNVLRKQAYKSAISYARNRAINHRDEFLQVLNVIEQGHPDTPYINMIGVLVDEGNGKSTSFNTSMNTNTTGEKNVGNIRWVGTKNLTINKFIKFIIHKLQDVNLMMPLPMTDKKKVKIAVSKLQRAIVNNNQHVSLEFLAIWLSSLPYSSAMLIEKSHSLNAVPM